jgi:hypothetical protein
MAALLESSPTAAGPSLPLQVRAVLVTATGVHVRFNQRFDVHSLGGAELPIVIVSNGQMLRGRAIADPDGEGFVFVADTALLPQGDYSIVLRSGPGGLRKPGGEALDGDADGQAGGNYKGSFTVRAANTAFGLVALAAMSTQAAGATAQARAAASARRRRDPGTEDVAAEAVAGPAPTIRWAVADAAAASAPARQPQAWVSRWLQSRDEPANGWRIRL